MKAAAIRARRTLADGRRLVNVVCPVCEHRHWVPEVAPSVECPRKAKRFTIRQPTGRAYT